MADNVVLSSPAAATVNDDIDPKEVATLKTTESDSRASPSSKSGVDFNALMKGPKSIVVYDIDLFTAIIDGRDVNQQKATANIEAFRKAANIFRWELDKIRSSS